MGKGPDIVARTVEFAAQIVRLGTRIPAGSVAGRALFSQVVRSGPSIGANVEEAQAGESRADFVHKYAIALKEARETHYWLRLFKASGILSERDVGDLLHESDEIRRILGQIIVNSKRNHANGRRQDRTG
jgi:four helix bundle protein